MASLKTTPKWYDRRPGYVRTERKAMFAKVGDWAFMGKHCHHTGRYPVKASEGCAGVRKHLWARPDYAK